MDTGPDRSPRAHDSFSRDAAFFAALLISALALGGALAHAYELPNKLGLSKDHYFIAQRIYSGWSQLAYVLLAQLISLVALLLLYRDQPTVRWLVIVALLGLVGSQVVFWIYTFPANTATEQWTVQPANWAQLRRQWEFSHLAGAIFQLMTMIALFLAVLARKPVASSVRD